MSKSKNRRPQTPKNTDSKYVREIQELRRSNAAGIHRTPKNYTRKVKHKNKGWD